MGSNETLIITEIDVNDGPKMPYRTPSGVVALATLAAVIAVFLISIVIYYYKTYIVNTYSRLNRQIKKKRRTSTAEVNDDEFQPEKLREDSVINHELDFNPDAFSYAGDVENSRKKPVPSPCPSIFADDLFLEEVMTSVADICSASKSMDRIDSLLYVNESNYKNKSSKKSNDAYAAEILDNIIDNVFEEKLHPCPVENENKAHRAVVGKSRLLRNKSYQDAIDGGLDTLKLNDSELSEHEQSGDNAVHCIFLPSDSDASKSYLDSSNPCLSKIELIGTQQVTSLSQQWQSTPILDDLNSSSLELQRSVEKSLLVTDLDQEATGLSQHQSYSPVYKLSFSEINGSNSK